METEKDEPAVHAEKQRSDDTQGIRSPAGRRSEALASVDSADQSIDSAGKSPQRKKRKKFPDSEELDKSKHCRD